MTPEEAKEFMLNEVACIHRADTCDRDCAKCDLVKEEDELLDAFATAIQALENDKQTPKKAKFGLICPNCNNWVEEDDNYCKNCGQKLDWSNEDD